MKISVTTKIQKPKILVKISVTPNWFKTGFFGTRQGSHFLDSRPGIADFRREGAAGEKILIFMVSYCRFTMGILLFRERKDDIPLVCARSAPEKNRDFGLQFFAKISVTKNFVKISVTKKIQISIFW